MLRVARSGRAWNLLASSRLLCMAALWLCGPLTRVVPAADDDSESVIRESDAVEPFARRRVRQGVVWRQGDVDVLLGLDDGGRSERRRLREVAEVSRDYDLTDDQQEKLRLAALLDAERFSADVAAVRRRVSALANGDGDLQDVRNQILDLRLRRMNGTRDATGLFIKTLRHILIEQSRRAPAEPASEPTRRQYRVAVEVFLAGLAEKLQLGDEQHAALVDLVLRETQPPTNFQGEYQLSQILVQLARVPPEKVNRLLDEQQRDQLNRQLAPYRLVAAGRGDDTEQAIKEVLAKLRRQARDDSE